MTQTIEAIYENGVFRPLAAVDLPENSVIELDLHLRDDESVGGKHQQEILSPADRVRIFLEWANAPRSVPDLPDEALRRENIYEDRV